MKDEDYLIGNERYDNLHNREFEEARRKSDREFARDMSRLSGFYSFASKVLGSILLIRRKRKRINEIREYFCLLETEVLNLLDGIDEDLNVVPEDALDRAFLELNKHHEGLVFFGREYQALTGKDACSLPDYEHSNDLINYNLKRVNRARNDRSRNNEGGK